MSPTVALDHIGVAVKDLERGRAAYDRLGFRLTPRSQHRGSPTPGAPVEPFGSGNHCAMLRHGYLEVVGLTDSALFSNVKSFVARYEGAHIVAMGVKSAADAYQALTQRGVRVDAPRQLERDAAYGESGTETRRAAFRNMHFARDAFPEAHFLFIEHLTRDVLWQPHLLDQPNGVTALSDIFICVPDVEASAEKLAALFATTAERSGEGEYRLPLARGTAWILSPAAWTRWAPGAPTPPLPSPVGIGFEVASVDETRRLLTERGVATTEGRRGGIWVKPEDACGTTLYFFEKAA